MNQIFNTTIFNNLASVVFVAESVDIGINKPLKVSLGFDTSEGLELLQVFEGVTGEPKVNQDSRSFSFHAYDIMNGLLKTQLPEGSLQVNVRTDVYIQSILTELGYSASDWVMDVGVQFIGFAWWGGRSAGTEIKNAVEAEGGRFYVNEQGKFVFENRQHYNVNNDHKIASLGLDNSEVINVNYNFDVDKIINSVSIKIAPLVESDEAEAWNYGIVQEIMDGESITVIADFQPHSEIETLVATTDFTANSLADGSGTDRTSDLDITQYNYVQKSFITIENTGATPLFLTMLKLRGKALRNASTIYIESLNQDSIDSFGSRAISLENPYFQDPAYAKVLADFLIEQYSKFNNRMQIVARGKPVLQLGDAITYFDNKTMKNYLVRVISIKLFYTESGMISVLGVREVLQTELLNYFTIGVSAIQSNSVISP